VRTTRIVIDSGALSTLAEKSPQTRSVFYNLLTKGTEVVVPAVVIAEATTGDHRRDAHVNRALKRTVIADLDAGIARSAAALRHAHRRKGAGTIDAIVVATADLVPGTDVITTDSDDLAPLAGVRGSSRIVAVSEVLGR
jgi:predicted nucleic acid-binding protein